VNNNGNQEGSSEETGGEEDREEDRKEEIGKSWGLRAGEEILQPLFFSRSLRLKVFSRYENRFSEKYQDKSTSS